MKRMVLGFFALVLIAGAAFVVPTWWFQPWSINHFYARVFLKFALGHPELLTQLGVLNGVPFGDWRDRLSDYSPAGEEADLAMGRDNLARLHRYDRSRMSASDQLSYDVMDWFLQDAIAAAEFKFNDYPLNQMFGFQSSLPDFMITTQPLKTPRDAESYLRRVAAFGPAFDQTLERVRLRDAQGVIPPRFVLREVREEMERFSGKPAGENDLVKRFVTGTDSIPGLDAERRDALRARLTSEVETVVIPAYRKMIAFVAEQEARATGDDGVWKLPNGDAYYDYSLRHHTTSALPADTIHALGLAEIRRLQDQMTALMDRSKVAKGAFGQRMLAMRKDPRFGFPAGDSGRTQIIGRYQAILDDASKRSDALFDVRPKGSLKVERIPPFKEATSPGAYYNPGAFDGSRPGVFFANLRDPAETRRPDMRTLAYHEGIPGHHFQLTVAQVPYGLPRLVERDAHLHPRLIHQLSHAANIGGLKPGGGFQ